MDTIILTGGQLECAFAPGLGGALLYLRRQGMDFVRPTRQASLPTQTAGYAMVPFCNRISGSTIWLDGRSWPVQPNFGEPLMPCHGDGWLSEWIVEQSSDAQLIMSLSSRWAPFSYRATQTITIRDSMLRISIRLTNEADHTMPMALGYHPFFPDAHEAVVTYAAQRFWLEAPDKVPTEPISMPPELDHAAGRPMSPHWRNNTVDGWDGTVGIAWRDGRHLVMQAEQMEALHIYRQVHDSIFCLEPQSCVSGAMGWQDGARHGVRPVASGEYIEASVTFQPTLR